MKNIKIIILLLLLIITSLFYFSSKKPNHLDVFQKRCQGENNKSKKIECWKNGISKYLESAQLDEVMKLVSLLYASDRDFSENCHDFTHLVGKKAYELFSNGKEFDVSPRASYCAYGFYHGFMGNLISNKGDMQEAKSFCDYVDAKVSKESPNAEFACYHGIGHGWANVHDEALRGDELAIIYPALQLCESITSDPQKLKLCATGVFDSISFGYYNQINDLKIKESDPFWICKVIDKKHKDACYLDLTPALIWHSDYNLKKSLSYLKNVEADYLDLTSQNIGENILRYIIEKDINFDDAVFDCRGLNSKLSQDCINGLALGFFQFASPGEEYKSALDFCERDILNDTERIGCINIVLDNLKTWVTEDVYKDVCVNYSSFDKCSVKT